MRVGLRTLDFYNFLWLSYFMQLNRSLIETSQTFSCLLPWLNQSEIRIFKIGATKNVSMNKMLLTRIEHNNAAAAGVIWSIGVEWAEQVTTSGKLKIRLSSSEWRQCEDFNASMFESSHLNVWNLVSSMTFPSALYEMFSYCCTVFIWLWFYIVLEIVLR